MSTTLSTWLAMVMLVLSFSATGFAAVPTDPELSPSYPLPKRYAKLQYAVGAGGHFSTDSESIQGVDLHAMVLSKGVQFSENSSLHVHLRPEIAYFQSVSPEARAMVTGTISGVLYPFDINNSFSPFVELTFGGVYSDYDVNDLGTSWNFLSGGGIGADFLINSVPMFFVGRFAHISNAGLSSCNGGFNWLTFILGMYF